MRQRIIQTTIVRDVWYLSLPLEERCFFDQLLMTDRAEISGVFEYPDRDILHDMPFLSPQRLQLLKQRFEADKKVFFQDGWVWLVNFAKHNKFTGDPQLIGICTHLFDLERQKPNVIQYFKQKGLEVPMSMEEYLQKRRRNQTKQALRKAKPWLQGAQLNTEVDRVLGIADSGKMDWATVVESGKPASEYQTPESVFPHIDRLAKQYSLKQSVLYWHFKKKVLRYQGSGRTKSDYLAVLEECATKIKPMKRAERIQAMMLYSKEVIKETPPMTAEQADAILLMKGDIE
jgi:hypothetical protein